MVNVALSSRNILSTLHTACIKSLDLLPVCVLPEIGYLFVIHIKPGIPFQRQK